MNARTTTTYIFLLLFFGFLIFSYFKYTNVPSPARVEGAPLKEEIIKQINNDIESTVIKVINDNPDIIIRSLQNHQNKRMQEMEVKRGELIKDSMNELELNDNDPIHGSKNAKIKIVEFFDYNCGYCKNMASTKAAIVANNKDIAYVFKEFPILGESSLLAAKSALAVNRIDISQYFAYHEALMIFDQPKTLENLTQLAACFGIDRERFINEINDSSIKDILDKNQLLARKIEVQGSPTYIINGKMVNSIANYESFQKYIDDIRNSTDKS